MAVVARSSVRNRPAARLHVARPAEFTVLPGARRPYRPPPGGLVERTVLTRRLATTTAPLGLLVAPAGYGKSATLAGWAERDPRPFAWISATPADNDPGHLLASVVRGLRELEPLPAAVVAAVPGDGAAHAEALALLTGALRLPRAPSVLVIDDAQAIRAPEAIAVLTAIAEHQPDGSIVVLASRAESPLPVGRLRAEGLVLELRAEDLAMNEREAAVLLRRAGLRLVPEDVTTVLRRTEGWPVALQLAGLVLSAESDPARAVAGFRGDARLVADYVADTLLAPLPADAVDLLLATSPLAELSGPLCDAVAGGNGAGGVLRDLARAGVPLVSLDRREERFRLHGIVADALLAELGRRDPAGEREAHRRASTYLARNGDDDGAIRHALAAGDHDRVGELLWPLASSGELRRCTALVATVLDDLTRTRATASPRLALAIAAASMRNGERDRAEHWTALGERGLDASPSAARPELRAAVAALHAAVARDGVATMAADAAQAYLLAPAGSPWRPIARHLEGTALHLLGDLDGARARLEEGARLAVPAAPAVRVLCLAQLGLLALLTDDVDEGLARCEEAHGEMARGAGDDPTGALALAVSAFARARAGLVAEARDDVSAAQALAATLDDPPPWYEAELALALARTELRLSDAAAARALLGHAGRSLRRLPHEVLLHQWIDDAWARVDAFAESAGVTPSTLTTAELRILRFLPSHLSFREIAVRLHVSANTVKTQAHAIYRKLGASSRSEAVARARAVGLLDG